jgi:hypothetical protein
MATPLLLGFMLFLRGGAIFFHELPNLIAEFVAWEFLEGPLGLFGTEDQLSETAFGRLMDVESRTQGRNRREQLSLLLDGLVPVHPQSGE